MGQIMLDNESEEGEEPLEHNKSVEKEKEK
jgi:hypothetical protein